MNTIKVLIIVIVSGLCVASCTIEERIIFNEDMKSGQVEYAVDMSMFYALYSSSEKEMDLDFFDGLDMENEEDNPLSKINGISNFQLNGDTENGIFSFSYQFDNLNALNESKTFDSFGENEDLFSFFSEDSKVETAGFKRKGKKIMYKGVRMSSNDLNTDENGNENPMFEGMGEMFKYKLSFEFPKPIKKFKNENYLVSLDRKIIQLEGDMLKMVSGEINTDFKAKF